ncbi:GNAT family N-acetyltransferase [Kribbella sp. NPDC006257]|uniref:GNAT family N-acetyltransferase n=1 Tax=Kribbella sp. NPDC006257 TaxID=3156738 RepID=UPI0033AAEE0E
MNSIAVLPDGYTVRSPEPADAEALFAMLAAYNEGVVGFADTTLEEVAYCIDRPGFEPATDGWLVLAADGRPAGYATTLGLGDRQLLDVEVTSQYPEVAGWLVDRTLQRAAEMGRERGHAEVTAAAAPYDEWFERHEDVPIFDWSQLTLLEIDGRVVAIRECNDKYVETDNCGHIGMLGVLEEFRGRGLATFLLRDAFTDHAASGRAGTILHVDTNNPTPALDLYLSVGMTPTVIFDGWRRVLSLN